MSGYVESYRGQVLASECDLLGHFNVQFYQTRLSLAMGNMFFRLGVLPKDITVGRRGFAVVHQENRFLAELLAGDIIHMESGVLKATNRTITIKHKLFNSATGVTAFTSRFTVAHMDLNARKSIPLTDAIREQVGILQIEGEEAE